MVSQQQKRYAFVGLVVVAVVAALLIAYFTASRTGSPLAGGEKTYTVEVKPTDRMRGQTNAPITILEYASMTCPHCAEFQAQTLPMLVTNWIDSGKAKLIFREYPLDGAARMASALARCVPADKFFPFIDLLFKDQAQWIQDFNKDGKIDRSDVIEGLTRMGRFAGMDQAKVESCVDDKTNLAIVDANYAEAQTRYDVDSTPTFIVNGHVHRGEWPYDDMNKYLQSLSNK